MSNFTVKKASSYTTEEQINMGIVDIPENWPIEVYPYTEGDVAPGFVLMTDTELTSLINDNQAAYDGWYASTQQGTPLIENYKVDTYSSDGILQVSSLYQDKDQGVYTNLARQVTYTYLPNSANLTQIDNITYDSLQHVTGHKKTNFYTDLDTNKVIVETEEL